MGVRDERGTRELAGKIWRSPHKGPGKIICKVTGMLMLLRKEGEERLLSCSLDETVALAVPFPSQLMTVSS